MNWSEYKPEYVRTAIVGGRRLVLDFANDFEEKFNYEICITCISKFNNDFYKYINSMSTQKSEFKLKAKYNNIPLGFGKRGRLSNENMNEKDAMFLLKNHPKGRDLFEKIPEAKPEKIKKEKGDN